ncbi:MAG: DUF4271 domain-containing protein [Flavobacteriia bacterium]|nr:DUF4271 domain-containing protein [Flavobacteriia bacterium]
MNEISYHLIERNSPFQWIPFASIIICLLILAFIRQNSPNFLYFFFKYFHSPYQLNKLTKEEFEIGNISSYFLMLLFFFNTSILIFLSIDKHVQINNNYIKTSVIIFPTLLYMWTVGALKFFSWISSERKSMNESIKTIIVNNQFVGIIQCVILLFWTFNPQLFSYFQSTFIIVQGAMWLFILIRTILISLNNSMHWYYIILYLCTLEILPLCLLIIGVHRLDMIKYLHV